MREGENLITTVNFTLTKDYDSGLERATIIAKSTLLARVMYCLREYGIERFDLCTVDLSTEELIATAEIVNYL